MRKITMLIAAAGLTAPVPLAFPTAAHAGYNNIPSFCKNYVASGEDPATNRGECIGLLTTQFHYYVDGKSDNAFAVKACDYYAETDPDFFNSLWDSKQECVDEILSL